MTEVMVRGFRHLLAGGIGTVAYAVLVSGQVELLGLHPMAAVFTSFAIVLVYTYVVNRTWVYSPSRKDSQVIPRFLTVVVVALLLNSGIMYVAVEVMQSPYLWGLVGSTLIVPPTNFLLNYYWAFR